MAKGKIWSFMREDRSSSEDIPYNSTRTGPWIKNPIYWNQQTCISHQSEMAIFQTSHMIIFAFSFFWLYIRPFSALFTLMQMEGGPNHGKKWTSWWKINVWGPQANVYTHIQICTKLKIEIHCKY